MPQAPQVDVDMTDISKVLSLIKEDSAAAEQLLPLVYDELRRLASAKLAQEKPGQTLQATALVHEAYLRLFNEEAGDWENRSHFFGAAAEAMRRILIEQARRKLAQKRGGDAQKIEIDMEQLLGTTRDEKLIAMDDALEKFESARSPKSPTGQTPILCRIDNRGNRQNAPAFQCHGGKILDLFSSLAAAGNGRIVVNTRRQRSSKLCFPSAFLFRFEKSRIFSFS